MTKRQEVGRRDQQTATTKVKEEVVVVVKVVVADIEVRSNDL